MKIFTVGPVQPYPVTARVYERGYPYFRTDEFSSLMLSNTRNLRKMLAAGEGSEIVYLASSGTGAMEAVVDNCLMKSDKSLVINGGTFGARFCSLLRSHGIDFDSVDLPFGKALTREDLDKFSAGKYRALLVNMTETSTGQLYCAQMLSDFCRERGMFFIVDAIGTFLADEFNMQKYGIDACIASSQKGLGLSPGMSIVALSPRMKERIESAPPPLYSYFDFKEYFKNNIRGQTPFTPPVGIIYELREMIGFIAENGGVCARLEEVSNKSRYFRQKALAAGLDYERGYPLSNILTPLKFEDGIDAYEIFKMLKDDFQIYVNPCGGELSKKILRVAHIGNTSQADFDDLIEKILVCLRRIKSAK